MARCFSKGEMCSFIIYSNAPHSFPTLPAAQKMHSQHETAVLGLAFVIEKLLVITHRLVSYPGQQDTAV